MKVALVFAALIATILASPYQQSDLHNSSILILNGLQPVVQCIQTAVQNGATSVSPVLANISKILTDIAKTMNCPPRDSSNALFLLQDLVTCVPQNSITTIGIVMKPMTNELLQSTALAYLLAGCKGVLLPDQDYF
ncbi:hypothetical protein FQA39_LY03937 [Lamprigera yunnana]|nr:hypothetical protein FQA39_LY03937 [Lamprigera yunnana]